MTNFGGHWERPHRMKSRLLMPEDEKNQAVVPGPSGPYLSLRNVWSVPSPRICAR